jgi:ParB family transcriptional regulator, chromosome partitioning protein
MTAEVKKRGLGRGLDALFQDQRKEEEAFQPKIKRADEIVAAAVAQAEAKSASGAASTATQRKVAVERLTPGKYQPRRFFDDAALDQLSDSIAAHGVLQPLLVRQLSGNMYEIIAGERRWRAAQKAQLHEVPVVIATLTDKEALEIALVENLQREDLTAVEEAEGYARLMEEFGHTQEALSQQLGKSRSHVANTLRLLKLPQSVRGMVQSNTLSAGHARALVGAKDPEALAGLIVSRGLSVRQTEALVQKATEGKLKPARKKTFVEKDVDVLALEELTSSKLGLRVTIASNGPAGTLSIEYKTLDQLDDLLSRLGQTPKR